MATTTTNKRKKAVAATVAAAALLLAGTFAWTSISQTALNEAIVDINPGGRLHDDFNGTNKDVYVENFNSEDDATAVPIYARIKLTEYMEVGQDAGKTVADGVDRKINVVGGQGTFGDTGSWQTYIPGDEGSLQNTANISNTHWTLTFGNEGDNMPIFMPTFNKNKDSLAADINGTYEGTVEGDIVHYDDYRTYAEGDPETDYEYYDWDSNATWESDDPAMQALGAIDYTKDPAEKEVADMEAAKEIPVDDYHVVKMQNEHKAQQISQTAKVITMAEWQTLTEDEKAAQGYWVYDTDGWAYWSKAIQPGETTGLFLDGINMKKVPDDNWYYGINVVGQFATPGDLKAFDMEESGGMSDAAKDMMAEVTKLGQTLTIETGDGSKTIAPGETTTITATEKTAGMELEEQPEITWNVTATDPDGNDVSDKISFDEGTGQLTVGEDVPEGTEITITAKTNEEPPIEASVQLTVDDPYNDYEKGLAHIYETEISSAGTAYTIGLVFTEDMSFLVNQPLLNVDITHIMADGTERKLTEDEYYVEMMHWTYAFVKEEYYDEETGWRENMESVYNDMVAYDQASDNDGCVPYGSTIIFNVDGEKTKTGDVYKLHGWYEAKDGTIVEATTECPVNFGTTDEELSDAGALAGKYLAGMNSQIVNVKPAAFTPKTTGSTLYYYADYIPCVNYDRGSYEDIFVKDGEDYYSDASADYYIAGMGTKSLMPMLADLEAGQNGDPCYNIPIPDITFSLTDEEGNPRPLLISKVYMNMDELKDLVIGGLTDTENPQPMYYIVSFFADEVDEGKTLTLTATWEENGQTVGVTKKIKYDSSKANTN